MDQLLEPEMVSERRITYKFLSGQQTLKNY